MSATGSMSNDQALRAIDAHLKQCKDYDKDQRYMATSDIGALLTQGIKLDAHREKEVCDAILKQFDDTSIDVQSIAVRTVPLLVAKSQQQQVVEICSQLCEKMLKGEESVRNLYAIGLKTCVSNLPEHLAQPVLTKVLPKLVPFIEKDTTSASVQDAIEVVNDLLGRFGPEMGNEHEKLIKMAIGQLSNPNNLVRKRAIGCLGALSAVCSDSAMNKMVETILGKIEGTAGVAQETIFVQAIGAIGRSAGNRLGAHMNRVVPLLFRHLKTADDSTMQNAAGDDHRENIFQGLESFVLRCPNEMQQHLEQVYKKTAEFLVYDPNFNYGDSGDDEMDYGGSEEEDDDYSNYGDDDDDTSWKVRRAAAKTLNSIILSRPDVLKAMYTQIQDLLQKRFQERVESVRLDVLEAYKTLLDTTGTRFSKSSSISDRPALVRQNSTLELLQSNLTQVIKALSKLMREKSKHAIKTKIMSFQVASKLISVVNGQVDEAQLELLLQPTIQALSDKNTTLRMEALIVCKAALQSGKAIPVPKCDALKTPILKCIQAEWFKIVAEALRCVSGLCRNVRPLGEDESMFIEASGQVDLNAWGSSLCDAILPRLKQHDIDQEIKNAAIEAAGVILSTFGDHVGVERERDALMLLLERTKNESSRLVALKAIERCSRSPATLSQLESVSPQIADELAMLLRQQSREIRQNALSAYIAMIDVAGFVPGKENLETVAGEMGNLIADPKDSHLVHLALVFCSIAIAKLGQPGKQAVKDRVLNQLLNVVVSSASLLTGQAYLSLMNLFQVMSSVGGDAGLGFSDLYPRLYTHQSNQVWASLHKPAMGIIAEACAVLLCACPDAARRDQTMSELVAISASPQAGDKAYQAKRHVALLLLGEVGRRVSLAQVKQPSPVDVVLQKAFEDEDEAVKVSAASSLGKLVVGDPKAFLPIVMKALEGREAKTRYLVLVSLRELVSNENASSHVAEWLSTVVKVLKDHCSEQNEEVRNMVAECFGKLAVLFPDAVIPELVSAPTDSKETKWTKISGMRYGIVALTSSANLSMRDQARKRIVATFRDAVSVHFADRDNLEVAKATLMAVHALVHHAPDLAAEIHPQGVGLIEYLYASTEVRPELQKKVDFGPFKVTVDDGLPLRKSAYSCLSALLENAPGLLGSIPGQLIPSVARGLDDSPEDAPDIPFLAQQILVQLCHRQPHVVIAQSQLIMKGMQKPLGMKLDEKDREKDPEKFERKLSVVKATLRTLDQIVALPGALDDRSIADTVTNVQRNEGLKSMAIEEGLRAVFKKGVEGGA